MSEILNRLKQAEAERERVIAERRRLEAEADAALAQRDREERAAWQRASERPVPAREPAQAPERSAHEVHEAREPALEQTPQQRSRLAAGLAIGVAMAVVFWIGTLVPGVRAPSAPVPPPAQAVVPVITPAAPVARTPPALFKLDRDADAFARRVGGKS